MTVKRPRLKQQIPSNARKVFTGKLFNVYQWQQELFNGKTATFEMLKRADSVNVIPVTPEGKIIIALEEQPGKEPFYGAFGGRIDAGETPEEAARRELREEAGLQAGELVLWDAKQITEKLDWVVYTFIARNCSVAGEQELEGGERIKRVELTFEEYIDLIAQENYRDDEIALALLKIKQREGNLDRVKQEWLGTK